MFSTDPLSINAVLDDLRPSPQNSTVYLVLSGEKTPSEDYLRLYRKKKFVSYYAQNARAFTHTGGQPSLPPQNPVSFAALCSMQGSTFVDKTASLHAALSLLAASRVNIIRRPKGFGKTAFLSMFDAFFDPLSAHAHFPFIFTEDMSRPIFRAHGRLLVFALDFADLEFKPTTGRDGLEAECDRLMNAASERFYSRYRDLLCVSKEETSRADFSPTFLDIIRWSKRQGWRLCFTMDNYTAPILNGPSWYYETSVSRDIFGRLYNLLSSGFFSYGLIVGEDVPHASEWKGLPETFMDLSDEPELHDSIGFTLDEIAALGQAVSIDLIATLPPRTPIGRYARRVYAAADIVALARSAMNPDSQSGPVPSEVRTVKFKSPPPVVTVDPSVGVDPVETQHEDYAAAADDDTIYDELVSAHFGPLCDDDDDDVDAQAPEMTDGSSRGSDPSPDVRSFVWRKG